LLPFSAVDIISAIEFNKSGHHLATGDRGGRVVLFERTDVKDVCILNCTPKAANFFPCIQMAKHLLFVFSSFSMPVEKMLRKLIILSAGIPNFATKLSFKAMNQRYILTSIVKWYYLSSELLEI